MWRKGLSISESGINVAPTIYLEEYYQQFQKGATMEKITEDILDLYGELRFQKPWYPEELNVYQEVREKIVYRLIHRERNRELLEQIPYMPWQDLAIVFVVLLEAGEKGSASMMICRDQLARWGVTREEVYRQACENTWRLLPVDFRSMGAVMEDALFLPSLDEVLKLYVLTNRWKNYGAAAALYEGQLQAVGEMFGENFYLIPSSVHEMLILPESRVPKREELDVNIGVLTVPIEIAQAVTDRMVAGGIKGVWNFTPFRIRVPEHIVVQNTSLYAHLALMFNRLNGNEP